MRRILVLAIVLSIVLTALFRGGWAMDWKAEAAGSVDTFKIEPTVRG